MEERPDTDANPYRAPDASLIIEDGDVVRDLPRQLSCQSTWILVLLTLVTYGIYAAHYAQRQSRIINQFVPEEQRISDALVVFLLLTTYLSAILFVPYVLSKDDDSIYFISSLVDMVSSILMLFWGFRARSRMNVLLRSQPKPLYWFHGAWTFLFTPFYFNYKVNLLALTARGGHRRRPTLDE